jgi:16S rRNA (uracil1498-N3)-methyltransferase
MEVESLDRRDTMARVVEIRPAPPEPKVAVTLYQCVIKADKFDLVLQKATELGVATLVPVISNRTVARLGRTMESKQARWESIVREAAEQSGRGGLPVVASALSFADAVANAKGTRLLPWEEGQANPGLLAALSQSSQPVEAVSILIGPEGGLAASEIEAAIGAGWQVASLGQRILRAETATIATLTVVMAALGELGDAPTVKLPAPNQASKEEEKKTRAKKAGSKKEVANEQVADAGKAVGDKEKKEAEKGKPKSADEANPVGSTTVGEV